MSKDTAYVVVEAYTSVHHAHLAKSVLDGAGIECEIADEHVVSMDWMLSNAVGGVKLLVSADRLDEAQALLKTAATIPPEDANDGAN